MHVFIHVVLLLCFFVLSVDILFDESEYNGCPYVAYGLKIIKEVCEQNLPELINVQVTSQHLAVLIGCFDIGFLIAVYNNTIPELYKLGIDFSQGDIFSLGMHSGYNCQARQRWDMTDEEAYDLDQCTLRLVTQNGGIVCLYHVMENEWKVVGSPNWSLGWCCCNTSTMTKFVQ